MTASTELASLVEQPFALLREIERKARAAVAGEGTGEISEEWTGIGFRIGQENFVADREQVREVLMLPDTMTRVPGAKRWLLGIANLRGHLLPLIDLMLLTGWTSLLVGFLLKLADMLTRGNQALLGLAPKDFLQIAIVSFLFAIALAARTWVESQAPAQSAARRRDETLAAYEALKARNGSVAQAATSDEKGEGAAALAESGAAAGTTRTS